MSAPVFRKSSGSAPAGYFRWEAAGLRWLRAAYEGAPVVEVLDVSDGHVDLARLTPVATDPIAAEEFGGALARVHDAGARGFGAPPDGWSGDGWLGPLSELLPLQLGVAEGEAGDTWGEYWAESRILPVLRMGVDRGVFDHGARKVFEALSRRCAAGEFDDGAPPARLHGDLWSGNLVWTAQGVVVIDPAAHGGHRETDLAMLALFDCPHLDLIREGYQNQHRLDAGWPERVALHQVHPLMLHTVIFGGSYLAQALAAARRYV